MANSYSLARSPLRSRGRRIFQGCLSKTVWRKYLTRASRTRSESVSQKRLIRSVSAELYYHCPPAGPPQWYKPVDPTSDSCLQIPELWGFNLWVWPERARNRAMEPCNPGTLKTRNPCRVLKPWNPESWGLGTLRTVQP